MYANKRNLNIFYQNKYGVNFKCIWQAFRSRTCDCGNSLSTPHKRAMLKHFSTTLEALEKFTTTSYINQFPASLHVVSPVIGGRILKLSYSETANGRLQNRSRNFRWIRNQHRLDGYLTQNFFLEANRGVVQMHHENRGWGN